MAKQSALVRNTLLTLSYRHRPEALDREYPVILVLLTHSVVGMEEGFRCIESLNGENVRLKLWVDDQVASRYAIQEVIRETGSDDLCFEESTALRESAYSHLLVPVLSYSLASRVVSLDDREPFSRTILQALMRGKKVAGLPLAADPYHPQWSRNGFGNASPLLKQEMKSRLQQLRGYGIEMLEADQVKGWIARSNRLSAGRNLLSQHDVLSARAKQQQVIDVPPHTIITPLARDLALQYGIELKPIDRGGER
ncbi:hypothetical protein [Ammoniphilus sp. 3BR4]|uniref:hypothetical protein n=1 Tax=Ammoniphilus sp. 3BR4 TaxID=3158265 RepID=UPI0034676D24